MRFKSYFTICGWLATILGASGIFLISDFYKQIGLSASFVSYGYIFCVTLIVLVLVTFFIAVYKLLRQNIRVVEFFNKNKYFLSNTCDEKDIKYIIENSSEESSSSTDDSETRRIFDLDPNSFTMVKDGRGRNRGYYCIIRLSKNGVNAIKQGVFSIKNLDENYIITKKYRYEPIYIAGIFGGDSGVLNSFILGEINGYVKAHKNRQVYARADTEKGLYWLNEYGFSPVRPEKVGLGHFYKKETKFA